MFGNYPWLICGYDFAWEGGEGGAEVTGMTEWGQKSKPPKIPRAFNTNKNPWTKN